MEKQTRREFLGKSASGVAFGAAGLLLPPLSSLGGGPSQLTAVKRGYTAGKCALEIDGQLAGWISSVEGGRATSDVVVKPVGSDGIQTKHIGGITYEPIVVNSGVEMSASYYQWIKDSLAGKPARKNGAVITADFDYKEQSRLEWYNAVVTEIGFPACDAGSKDPAKMTLKFAPESTRMTAHTGGTLAGSQYKNDQAIQKKWLPSNFRLKIDGLDCSRVNKVEAITARTSATSPSRLMTSQQVSQPLQAISNVVVTLPEASAKSFYDWYGAAVLQGNIAQREKSGKLEYLSPDLKTTLLALTFPRLTILKFTVVRAPAGVATVRNVQVEMACAGMGFEWNAAFA